MQRMFAIIRDVDTTGRSGTGLVAEGVIFSDGTTVIRWTSELSSTTVFEDFDTCKAIHGHPGTHFVVSG
jgi:hypothetical protein